MMGFGDEALVAAANNAPITAAQAAQAKAELARMQRSLTAWLGYRTLNDRGAAGQIVPQAVLKRPGARPVPPEVLALRLRRERAAYEQGLADDLHALLSEVFDPAQLPSPNVAANPNAAVALAQIAIAGKLPGTAAAASPQGFFWVWPVVIVVGAIVFAISSKIRSDADVAKEKEHYACIQAGYCTDSGFWLKIGAVGFLGWLAWDKLGLGERLTGAFAGQKGRRR